MQPRAAELSIGIADYGRDTEYLIWSHHHERWWGPDGCGYYRDITNAGRYTLDATEY